MQLTQTQQITQAKIQIQIQVAIQMLKEIQQETAAYIDSYDWKSEEYQHDRVEQLENAEILLVTAIVNLGKVNKMIDHEQQ